MHYTYSLRRLLNVMIDEVTSLRGHGWCTCPIKRRAPANQAQTHRLTGCPESFVRQMGSYCDHARHQGRRSRGKGWTVPVEHGQERRTRSSRGELQDLQTSHMRLRGKPVRTDNGAGMALLQQVGPGCFPSASQEPPDEP